MSRMTAFLVVGLVLLVACSGGGAKHPSAAPSTADTGTPTTPTSSSSPVTGAGDQAADAIVAGKGRVDADVVVVALDSLTFDQPQYVGKADLTIGYLNAGVQEHHLRIEGRDDFSLVVATRGASRVADIHLARRTYTIYCDRPGHRQAGMEAKLVIP